MPTVVVAPYLVVAVIRLGLRLWPRKRHHMQRVYKTVKLTHYRGTSKVIPICRQRGFNLAGTRKTETRLPKEALATKPSELDVPRETLPLTWRQEASRI
jgi:hypothetical protein